MKSLFGRMWLTAGALCLCAGLSGAQEVPAIVNAYRADPTLGAAAAGLSKTNGSATFTLTPAQVRELYYQCSIAGPMQGEVAGGGAYGANVKGIPYNTMAKAGSAKDRLPGMTLVRNAGPDGIYGTADDRLSLFVTISKLPLQATCQKVVDDMATVGLLPKTGVATTDPVATGNWRMLIHPPRGKGAPPAPCLYYPEALGGMPAVAGPDDAVFQEFWGAKQTPSGTTNPLQFRYRDWDQWVRQVWTGAASPVSTGITVANGITPLPWFLLSPGYVKAAEKPAVRTDPLDGVDVLGTYFFNPKTMWENRLFDPDGTILDNSVALSDAANWYKRKPPELSDATSDAARPIEVRFRMFPSGNTADPTPAAQWALPGLDTTGRYSLGPVLAGLDHGTVAPDSTVDGSGVITTPGNALTIEVDLLSGWYRPGGNGRWYDDKSSLQALGASPTITRPVVPGVGMVELQFEYDTCVPVAKKDADPLYTGWQGPADSGDGPWPFGTGLTFADAADNDDSSVKTGGAWDLTVPANRHAMPLSLLQAHAPKTMAVTDGRKATGATPTAQLARDPINIKVGDPDTGATTGATSWHVRRYSGWPYNPAVSGVAATASCGPIVCRYMVSALNVLPQEASTTNTTGRLQTIAQYDPTTGAYYPQQRVLPTALGGEDKNNNGTLDPGEDTNGNGVLDERDVNADLERPNFLIGYQPDGGASGGDYFLPISPGAKSSVQNVVVQAVQSLAPGGINAIWTGPAPTNVILNGPDNVATGWNATAGAKFFDGYDFTGFNAATAGNEAGMLYAYDLAQTQTGVVAVPDPLGTGLLKTDLSAWDASKAFDGLATTSVALPSGRVVGREFDEATLLDRIELLTDDSVSGKAVTDYVLQGRDAAGNWSPLPSAWTTLSPGRNVVAAPNSQFFGIRVVNTAVGGPDGKVAEIRLVTRVALRSEVSRPPTAPSASSDPDIPSGTVSGSAIHVSTSPDRELRATADIGSSADNLTTLDLMLEVPRYQPPSRDAVERQIYSEKGQAPTTWKTHVAPEVPGVSADWDRYRGTVRVFADDARTFTNDATDGAIPKTTETSNTFDASLYRLVGGGTQFVRWYDEAAGTVATTALAAGQYGAPLDPTATAQQHVAIESYAPFDVEFSVAYERRMSIAEKFLDFGKSVHGGVSQWVPVTLTNEGNVPLRKVKLYVDAPMAAVQLADSASMARLAQLNPIPAWFFQNLAISASGEAGGAQLSDASSALNEIFPASPGSPSGRVVTNVYLRVGRNDLGSPTQRIPVGQPMGNYTGRLRAFTDDLGAPGNDVTNDGDGQPDTAGKVAVGGSAVMKMTVQESPLAPITDFWDNETSRNPESGSLNNTGPYNAATGTGTYQPVPVFGFNNFSHPDVADATPTIAVQQDLSQMGANPPNASDRLTVMWSRFLNGGGGTPSWDVWFQQAGRPNLASVLSSNYRSFVWPAAPSTAPVNAPVAGERNLYPNVCPVPGTNQYVLMWHNEADNGAQNRRSSSLRLARYDTASGSSGVISLADDQSGNGLVNKQIPRAFVNAVAGAGTVLWTAWQTGSTGKTTLGFNAITLPGSVTATTGYTDAIAAAGGSTAAIGNYDLRTAPGLTNLAEPWILPSFRNEVTNTDQGLADPRTGNMRLLNGFYSAWSPVWQNQDIYWTRYRALQDPAESAAGDNVTSWKEGLANSPMVEDAYRLVTITPTPGPIQVDYPAVGNTMTLTSLPGGRVPFPRFTNDLMFSTPEHVAYVSSQPDWVMPGAAPRYSYCDPATPGTRQVVKVNHRGFADTILPITDRDANNNAVPLVQLRLFPATTATQPAPNLNATPAPTLLDVGFDLPNSLWDEGANEWVMPVDMGTPGGALLATRGISAVRVQPGLGRITFNAPVWKSGQNNPIYVYASYRPCTWRMTSDPAVDAQPTASFDWWERLVLVWRRGLENGRGQLWYRTYSLAVPLLKPPVVALDSLTDMDTGQAIPGAPSANDLRDGMLNLPSTYAGHRLQIAYRYTYQNTATATATGIVGPANPTDPRPESAYVPGSGPERLVPMDGLGSESSPALAVEHYFAGYPFTTGATTTTQPILSGRFWLAWVSTRDLYKPNPTGGQPPLRGTAAAHVYYGTFMPDFGASAEAR